MYGTFSPEELAEVQKAVDTFFNDTDSSGGLDRDHIAFVALNLFQRGITRLEDIVSGLKSAKDEA